MYHNIPIGSTDRRLVALKTPSPPLTHTHITVLDTNIGIDLKYDSCYTAAVVNTTITLHCSPPNGVPDVRVSWYKNQVKLRQIEDPDIVFTQSKRIMRVLNLSLNDSGVYHCRANNDLGIIRFSENKSVNVQGEPSIGWYIASCVQWKLFILVLT